MSKGLAVFIAILLLAGGILLFMLFITNPGHRAAVTVRNFYQYEQKAEFSDSWQLLHSQMKDKFTRNQYIQERSDVMLKHFGGEKFTFTINHKKKLKGWKMADGAKPIGTVYSMRVTQDFHGEFGNFTLYQDVFAAKENGKWTILWDYKN
ncbi:hypothetical protein Q7A53_11175 [Halobacillus rhizosphaerae]|uniref:hypothetical protein n=1 Tax=Halobacillus rhizosphaerae TaxID=3064889 RepID=UPI00398A7FE8